VQLTNTATAVATAAQSNAEGYYVLPPVQPGRYTITASATGFKEARIEGFRLEIAQARTIHVQLTPGEVKESITITDAAPLLTASKADRGSVVENKFLMSIPLNVRNPYLLLANVPGVTMGRLAGDNTASQSTTNNFRINGGRGSTSEILIDGAANTGTYNNQVSAMPQLGEAGGAGWFRFRSSRERMICTGPSTSFCGIRCWTRRDSIRTGQG
jgi:hypothetical protein